MRQASLSATPSVRSELKTLLVAFAAIGIASPGAAQETVRLPYTATDQQAAAIQEASIRTKEWMTEQNLPGVSVALGIDGELVWAEGFGWADLEQRVPVTPLTRFRIGSASKALTSVAAGLLHEAGELDFDAPIRTYLPDFPRKRWPITTRQLMGHVAGVRHYEGDEPYSAEHFVRVEDALQIFASDTLMFEPGTRYSYSTYGWNLVSAVVERAAGRPFLQFMREAVLSLAGMRRTAPDDVFAIVPDRARFYVREADGALRNERFVDQSNKWGGGGFLSTPSDLVRFGLSMLDAELLEPETVALLWTPVQLESGKSTRSGLGWMIADIRGRSIVASPGSSAGGRTAFVLFPDDDMVIAVASNATEAEVTPIWQVIYRLFRTE